MNLLEGLCFLFFFPIKSISKVAITFRFLKDTISVSHFFLPTLPSFFSIILSPHFPFPFVVTTNGQWKLEESLRFWSAT